MEEHVERTSMSDRELMRATVLARVVEGELTSEEGAELLALSVRQVKRLRKRFVSLGAKGLAHGNLSKPSNHAHPEALRARVIELIQERYSGPAERGAGQRFGPTLVAEHLLEDEGIKVPVSSLRRWMKIDGLWTRKRRWYHRFRRRERRSHFGELVQLDGSFHDWLEGRGPGGCLMTMTDDSTGRQLALMGKEETLWSAAALLQWWVEEYGVPRALYTDLKTLYHSPGRVSDREYRPLTQFGLMCSKLGIELIPASSPQAKGRVERTHGTNQDRLVKKLRLKGISTHEEMNRYLRELYLPAHNARFSKPPANSADYHLPFEVVIGRMKPEDIWCREEGRQLSNDGVISYGNRKLQVTERRDMPQRSKVVVRITEDGSIRVIYRRLVSGEKREEMRENELKWQEHRPTQREPIEAKLAEARTPRGDRLPRPRPGANHPWRLKNSMDVAEALQVKRELQMQTTPQSG
jgi:hypothetical protein